MSKFVSCGDCKFYHADRIKWGITSGFCRAHWWKLTGEFPAAFDYPTSKRMYEKEKIVCKAFVSEKPSQTIEATQ